MDSSCGESSVGVKAGEELRNKSVIQAPTSVLQSMRERLFLLEIKEKEKEEQERREKEEEEKRKKAKAKANAEEGADKAREKSKARRAKEKAIAKGRANAETYPTVTFLPHSRFKDVIATKRANGANAEVCADITRENTVECAEITRANGEEAARPIDPLEINMKLEAREELGKISENQAIKLNQIVQLRKAQEAVEAEGAKPMVMKKPKANSEKTVNATVARVVKMRADGVAMIAKMSPEERNRIIRESAESARKNDEAAKAKEAGDDARWLENKEIGPAQCAEESFAANFYSMWNKFYSYCGATFDQTTSIPAMRHTNPASDCFPKAMDTLQIMSVKLTSIKGDLHLPQQVFGIIAARDFLDRKRNIIFNRPRTNCQTITQDDCYLALEGPTRAIVVSYDPTYLEVSLKVKGTTESEDKDLSDLVLVFRAGCCPQSVYPSRLSTLEIKFDHIYNSVEATIFIRIIGGSWPDGFRGVFSAAPSSDDTLHVKLLDFEDGRLPVDANGVIMLSRRVVSVELERNLKVSVVAFSINKGYAAETSEAVLKSHRAGLSPPGINLCVGSCSMEVRVAWSCFSRE